MDNLVGRQIDQFQIEKHLAKGGMADVYLARDVSLSRPVALKVMLSGLVKKDELIARFQREARTIARLDHPNIIQIYTTGLTPEGQPYLAMQYIAGGSLEDELTRLAKGGELLSIDRVFKVALQVADALKTAHAAGVVHRDLKPSNILLQNDGTAVVSDLGIAAVQQATTRLTRTGHMMGTPYYMSPEQASSDKIDGRADIYALGIILYEMFSGSVPFTADSPLGVLHQQIYDPPPPLAESRPGLSSTTYQLVEICLQKDPARRFQTAEKLYNALNQALQVEQGLPPTELLITPSDDMIASVNNHRKRPIWLLAAVAAVVVFVCAFAFTAFILSRIRDSRSQPEPSIGVVNLTATGPAETPSLTPTTAPTAMASITPEPIQTSSPLPTDTAVPPIATTAPVAATIAPIIVANVDAPYFSNPAIIDGNLNEWTAVTSILVAYRTFEDETWDGTEDLTAVWRLAWDETNLYLAVSVMDDIHVQNRSGSLIYQGDSVDMQLDIDRTGDLSDSWNGDDYQITLSPGNFGDLPPSVFRWTADEEGHLINAPDHFIIVTAQQTGAGYTIEAAVPWADFNFVPTAGLVLGAAFNATDNDRVGESVQEVFYSHVATRTLLSPNSWGTLTLLSGN